MPKSIFKKLFIIAGCLMMLTLTILSIYPKNLGDINQNEIHTSQTSPIIFLDGNEAWVDFKNYGHCSGSGTSSDPYIINNIKIDGGCSDNCIEITNSQVHFKIENCELYNGINGLMVHESENGQIINNHAHSNVLAGIFFDPDCENFMIQGNSLTFNDYGIALWTSNHNTIRDNEINNNNWGILLDPDCNDNEITNNIINTNGVGIGIQAGSDHNWIVGNTIRENTVGIQLDQSICNFLFGNNFIGNQIDQEGTQEFCPTYIIIIALASVGVVTLIITPLVIIRRKKKIKLRMNSIDRKEISANDIPAMEQETQIEEKPMELKIVNEVIEEKISESVTSKEESISEANKVLPSDNFAPKEEIIPLETSVAEESTLDIDSIPSEVEIEQLQEITEEEIETVQNVEEEKTYEEKVEKEPSLPLENEEELEIEREKVEEIKEEAPKKVIPMEMGNLICRYCGFKNKDDAIFCVQCGQVIKN